MTEPVAGKFAYADPPYIGQSARLYGKHKDYAGEVDHAKLIPLLEDSFDGWALSCSMKSLHTILPMCPSDVKVASWIKPNTAPPMGDGYHYSWEPVIFKRLRRPVGHEWLHLVANVEQYTFREKPDNYVVGAKPEKFSHWMFRLCGLTPDDAFYDLFPGSGGVGHAWDTYCADNRMVI